MDNRKLIGLTSLWGLVILQKLYIIQGQIEGTYSSYGAKALCSVCVFIVSAISTFEMLKATYSS